MQPGRSDHISEEDLESYSMNRLPEERMAAVEEHLLVCPECQDRLEETDSYIRAIRSAAVRSGGRDVPFRRPRSWRVAWVAAASAALLVAVVATRAPREAPAPVAVVLEAVRGPMTAHAAAPSGHPLVFSMDLTDLPEHAAYRVAVVDEHGRRVWDGAAAVRDGRLAVTMPKHLSPGRYYVRLYSPAAELLREYGVETAPR